MYPILLLWVSESLPSYIIGMWPWELIFIWLRFMSPIRWLCCIRWYVEIYLFTCEIVGERHWLSYLILKLLYDNIGSCLFKRNVIIMNIQLYLLSRISVYENTNMDNASPKNLLPKPIMPWLQMWLIFALWVAMLIIIAILWNTNCLV